MTIKLKFQPPDRQAPGYLRRLDTALKFTNALQIAKETKNYPDNLIPKIIDFLAPYIVEPADKQAAIEALWDCSEEQFFDMVNSISGSANANPTPATT